MCASQLCLFSTHFLIILHSEYIVQEDLTKAARKVGEAKKHEGKFLVSLNNLLKTDKFTRF